MGEEHAQLPGATDSIVGCNFYNGGGEVIDILHGNSVALAPGSYVEVRPGGHIRLGPGTRIRALDGGGFAIEFPAMASGNGKAH